MVRARTGNRTDLNNPKAPVSAAPGQEYGEANAQRQAQLAVPMAAQPPTPSAVAPSASAPAAPRPPVMVTPLDAPSERPDEPITAGLPSGPGAGSEAMGVQGMKLADILGMLSNDPHAGAGTFEMAAAARSMGL